MSGSGTIVLPQPFSVTLFAQAEETWWKAQLTIQNIVLLAHHNDRPGSHPLGGNHSFLLQQLRVGREQGIHSP